MSALSLCFLFLSMTFFMIVCGFLQVIFDLVTGLTIGIFDFFLDFCILFENFHKIFENPVKIFQNI